MRIRTLIVDDEALARERIRQLLQNEADIQIVGECAEGQAAVAVIRKDKPDLVFLDIQMPELDGFEVLDAVRGEAAPVVVFVTAYDKFALKAFEAHAVDYLLKPFDRERFEMALQHAIGQVKRREGQALAPRFSALVEGVKGPAKSSDRLSLKVNRRIVFVKLDDIDWLEAAHNYVELHVGQQSHLLRQTVESIETRLPPEKFLRISRSVIVNTERIKELQSLFHGGYAVTLHDGTRLTLSRRYRDALRRLGLG